VQIKFESSAIDELARAAEECNRTFENIGARRLHTLVEKILADILFDADAHAGEKIVINKEYLRTHIGDTLYKSEMGGYIL
jgi:ATP-dependent HslUV protease ATP-binding subunit HslU